jgi:DNA mismatch repair protein MutH
MMPLNHLTAERAITLRQRTVGAIYLWTRVDENGRTTGRIAAE